MKTGPFPVLLRSGLTGAAESDDIDSPKTTSLQLRYISIVPHLREALAGNKNRKRSYF